MVLQIHKPDTQNKATADATATKAVLKAKLVSDDAKTDSASEPSTLLELAQAIKGLDANKQNAIVADYNKRMATVKAGTMYVLSDGELLPVKVRATNIALTQSYKTDTGTTLSPTTTTNVTADENIK